MRGEIIYKILDFLEDRMVASTDFFGVILNAKYGVSSGVLQKEFNKTNEERLNYQINREEKRKLQKYICKLKSDGLVLENKSKQFVLSSKGKNKLNKLKKDIVINKNFYEKENGDKVIIISYDIPILFNRERDILRGILEKLGFNMVHKSVWVGKVKLPEQFIRGMKKLGILDYLEILEVTKSGSLKSYN